MNITYLILASIAGYLIGSISFSRVVTRLVKPEIDLDQTRRVKSSDGDEGTISGIGAYTTSIALGGKYGGLVGVLDILKALLPVLILKLAFPGQPYAAAYSIFAILGHNFPIYYRFVGGRGLSVMLGSLLVLDPIGMIVSMVVGMFIGILINQPVTGMLLWMPVLSLWAIFVRNDLTAIIYSILLIIIYIISNLPELRHAANIRKEGRIEEYNQMLNDSAPMMRMINQISDTVRFWDKSKTNQEDA
jgi:glycerol-3-phosphate acyltransferase PlsY